MTSPQTPSETSPLINLFDYEAVARERMASSLAYHYFAGGAEDEVTLRDNREAFNRIRLLPRVMVDISVRDLSTTILGQRIGWPLLIAPTAFAKLAHPEGELGIARAAAKSNVPFILSTLATTSLEDVAADQPGAALWLQLYVFKDREVTRDLVQRAEAAGYGALALTVDNSILGRRERDIRRSFHLPPGIVPANFVNAENRPIPTSRDDPGLSSYIASLYDASLNWKDIDWLRSITSTPIVVKGTLRGEDAARAVDHGAAAIIVSNHGGRQLDTVPATIEALPRVVEAVAGRAEVLMDGGVRRGTDIVKALALGAKAVCIGRAALWGLAVNGEAGVHHVLSLLHNEFDIAMGLCGCPTVADVTRDLVEWS